MQICGREYKYIYVNVFQQLLSYKAHITIVPAAAADRPLRAVCHRRVSFRDPDLVVRRTAITRY